jgi:uncharacterized protein
MQIYRQLAYNNVECFLATWFPVVKATLGAAPWAALVRDFLRRRRCETPYLFEIGEEFLSYLQDERGRIDDDPPFLLELAHYEWVELALEIAEASPPEETPALLEDPLSQTIYLSELAWPLAYRFPVHRIGPDYRFYSPPPEPTLLLVYRDRDDKVRFMEIGVSAYRLLAMLQHDGPIAAGTVLGATEEALEPRDQTPGLRDLLTELARLSVIGVSGGRAAAHQQ